MTEPARAIICTPRHNTVSAGLFHSVSGACSDRSAITSTMFADVCSSVLPSAFNELFCHALDARDEGLATHMAMIHSDIWAERGWLNALYNEMWASGAVAVSAVVPIKGDSGRTSTAIGYIDDPWAVKRCFFLHERENMPETFGTRAVCRPGELLLINTGLMLLDLMHPFWDDFVFEFHNRIDRTPKASSIPGIPAFKRKARERSEDWNMSHFLHSIGAPYLATWKPRVRHEGTKLYANYDESGGLAKYPGLAVA